MAQPTAFESVRAQLRANPRLRAGLVVIAAVLAVYAWLVLWDLRTALHARYQQRTEQLVKVVRLSRQDEWLAHAAQARTLRQAVQAQVPDAASIGIAQADIQAWIGELLNAFGEDLKPESLTPSLVPNSGGLWRVPVVLRGAIDAWKLVELLRRVEANERVTVIDAIQITRMPQRMQVEITVVGYYRLPAKAGTP